jgi:hypothetical protein
MDGPSPAISPLKFYDVHPTTGLVPSSADVRHSDAFAADGASILCAVRRAFDAPLRTYGTTNRALDRLARAA